MAVQLNFQITQHFRDEQLIRFFINYFNCGSVYIRNDALDFKVAKFSSITEIIIPFFKKYPILGSKKKRFWGLM